MGVIIIDPSSGVFWAAAGVLIPLTLAVAAFALHQYMGMEKLKAYFGRLAPDGRPCILDRVADVEDLLRNMTELQKEMHLQNVGRMDASAVRASVGDSKMDAISAALGKILEAVQK